ncbi:DUF2103 domain-containing protein [Prochlorococcus sp. MIT 0916]|uniref:DUF2103 domain-containing protein n=1 Tax=Prochlorococcus sp. MIT 0916 TaxID=3082521 RepID=UPI0039B627B6
MGRLVQNHSTYIDGLIKWLKKIAATDEIKTVTPASMSKTNGKGENLALKVTVKTKEGYKLLARKGKLVQEVFLVTSLDESKIIEIIEKTNPKPFRKRRGC